MNYFLPFLVQLYRVQAEHRVVRRLGGTISDITSEIICEVLSKLMSEVISEIAPPSFRREQTERKSISTGELNKKHHNAFYEDSNQRMPAEKYQDNFKKKLKRAYIE